MTARPETCWQALAARPHEFRLTGAIAALTGLLMAGGFWLFVALTAPAPQTLVLPVSVSPLPEGGTLIVARYLPGSSDFCVRQWTETLCQNCAPAETGEPRYYALAAGTSGRGFGGLLAGPYTVLRYVPPAIRGRWHYYVRVFHSCDPFGWVDYANASEPVILDIP